jgi:hypothetical protein
MKPLACQNFDGSYETNFTRRGLCQNLTKPKLKLAEKRRAPILENAELGK